MPQQQLKIAFLVPSNSISGGLFVAYRHAHYLAAAGHDVVVIFQHGHDPAASVPYPDFALRRFSIFDAELQHREFDLVVSCWWECFYGMFFLKSRRYAHFIQGDDREACRAQSGGHHKDEALIRFAFSHPRVGYLAVARWLTEKLAQDCNIIAGYCPNGIDNSRFNRNVTPQEPKGARPRILIEGPGALSFKRVGLAYEVAARFPDCEIWHVCSDGVYQPHWQAHRRFTGVSMAEMPRIYAACDVLLKLSQVEGFFGPPLEMMACGGLCVVGRVKGMEEYIVEGENAVVVHGDAVEEAVGKLRQLLSDPALQAKLRKAGAETALRLDWSLQAPKFAAAIREIVAGQVPWHDVETAAMRKLAGAALGGRFATGGAELRRGGSIGGTVRRMLAALLPGMQAGGSD